MFKRPRLSAQTFPVNAGIAGFLLFYAASCSGPQEPADEAGEAAPSTSEQQAETSPLPANALPAVWSTRPLDAPIQSIGIAGGAGSTFAVAYEGGGLQVFDFDGERITGVSDDQVRALGEGRYALLSGTPVTVFPGIDANGTVKVWLHGGGLGEAIAYDLQGEQAGPALGLCASPPAGDSDALHNLAYWTEAAPNTLEVATIRESGGELELVSEGQQESEAPITACTISEDGPTIYRGPVEAAASLRRLGRETIVLSEGDGDLKLQIGENDPARYEVIEGITIKVPSAPTAMAATGDARGGGYPGGIIVLGGAVGPGENRAVLIDPSRVTMTPIEVPSAVE